MMMGLIPLQADGFEFIQDDVSGLMLKDISFAEFLKTVRSVFVGKQVLPPR